MYIANFDLCLKAMGSINFSGYCGVMIWECLQNSSRNSIRTKYGKFASSIFEKSIFVTITVVKFGLKLYTVLLTVYCSWPSKYSLVRKQTYQLIL